MNIKKKPVFWHHKADLDVTIKFFLPIILHRHRRLKELAA
jgi:hypothetical protein